MSYQQNWLRAVALKQAYPGLNETGAEEPPAPYQPTVAEMAPAIAKKQFVSNTLWAGVGVVVGSVVTAWLIADLSKGVRS